MDIGRTCGTEITFVRVVGSFAVIHGLYQLRDQEIEIGIALSMCIGRHIDWQAVDEGREVGAMVKVVATQPILVCLAIAGMLRHHHAGHGLQDLTGAQQGQIGQSISVDHALGRRVRAADMVVVMALDQHRWQFTQRKRRSHCRDRRCRALRPRLGVRRHDPRHHPQQGQQQGRPSRTGPLPPHRRANHRSNGQGTFALRWRTARLNPTKHFQHMFPSNSQQF